MQIWSLLNPRHINVLSWVAVLSVSIMFLLLFGMFVWATISHFESIMQELSRYIIRIGGLAGMGLGALLIISIFRNSDDPVKMNMLGVEFTGGSGPIVLWVLLFLSMVVGSVAIFNAV